MKKYLLFSLMCFALVSCESTPVQNTSSNEGKNAAQQDVEGDRKITQKVRQMLQDDKQLAAYANTIQVSTINGIVTLNGAVATDKDKTDISDRVKKISGVKRVENLLTVNTR